MLSASTSHEPERVGRLRPGAALRRRWAVGWTSDEVGPWACPVGRWNGGHAAGATAGPFHNGIKTAMECPSNPGTDDCRVRRDRDSRQRRVLAAVRPVLAIRATAAGDPGQE